MGVTRFAELVSLPRVEPISTPFAISTFRHSNSTAFPTIPALLLIQSFYTSLTLALIRLIGGESLKILISNEATLHSMDFNSWTSRLTS